MGAGPRGSTLAAMSQPPRRPRYDTATIRRRQRVALGLCAVLAVGAVTGVARLVGGEPAQAAPERSAAPARPTATPTSAAAARPTSGPVVQAGSGTLDVVPGSVPAPGAGKVVQVRVVAERGAGLAPALFADAVMATLNDPRSWGHGGTRTFARTDGDADVEVVLTSPATAEKLCRPLVTRGTLSCSVGDRAILTNHRWRLGTEEFPDLGVYRQYVVNHEVGHVLGHGHAPCPGAGQPAPVMQQQTKQVAPCTPNAWPFP